MTSTKFTPNNVLKHWGLEVARGNVPNTAAKHQFGSAIDITTSYTPVTTNQVYMTKQVAGAVSLRIKAGGNANDTAAGSGAREVTLVGLDETGAEVTKTVATAGASASSATTATFIRLYDAYVSSSGAYGLPGTGAHSAAITIEDSGGTADWAVISATGYPHGKSHIGCYSVPLGKQAFITHYQLTMDGNKPVDFILITRENILETAAPYTSAESELEVFGLQESLSHNDVSVPAGPYPALTDLIWMAKGASAPDVTVDFEILLEDA